LRINIIYFTSTGNTLWLAERAKTRFEAAGHTVRLSDVVTDGLAAAADCDMLGIFYPVWGSTLPDPFRQLIPTMPNGGGKRLFLIGDCGIFSGDTGIYWARVLRRHGYDVFYIDHVIMPINVSIPGFNFFHVPQGDEIPPILEAAKIKLAAICDGVLAGDVMVSDGTDLVSIITGGSQRLGYPVVALWKGMFSVDQDRCIHCNLCVRMCPTGRISMSEEGEITFDGECWVCLRCYNLCPRNAVLIGKRSANDRRFVRYKGPEKGCVPPLYR